MSQTMFGNIVNDIERLRKRISQNGFDDNITATYHYGQYNNTLYISILLLKEPYKPSSTLSKRYDIYAEEFNSKTIIDFIIINQSRDGSFYDRNERQLQELINRARIWLLK